MADFDENCVFCKIVRGEIPSKKVYNDDNFIGILDINPKAEGHTLIISKKHFKNILDIPNTLGNEILEAIKDISLDLIKQGKGEGFNVIANNGDVAGQAVNHFHLHIIPRKSRDGLKSMA